MSDFHEFVLELFSGLGPVRLRRMFGGAGLFAGDQMFGIVIDDVLYLKVDDVSRATFEDEGCKPFTYARGTREHHLSYFTAPERIFDDPDEARAWGLMAIEAAQRAKPPARTKTPSRKKKKASR